MTAKIVFPGHLIKGAKYWLERRGGGVVKVTLGSIDRNAKQHQDLLGKRAYDFLEDPYDDNKAPAHYFYDVSWNERWRCWSHEPTEEQMEAEKWNG